VFNSPPPGFGTRSHNLDRRADRQRNAAASADQAVDIHRDAEVVGRHIQRVL